MLATIVLIIHILVGVLMCVVILMQSSKGEGLSGAFGMGQGTSTFFGADTANVLVKITWTLAITFMVTTISYAYIQARSARSVAATSPVVTSEEGGPNESSMSAPPGEDGEANEDGGDGGPTAPEAGDPVEPSTDTGTTGPGGDEHTGP